MTTWIKRNPMGLFFGIFATVGTIMGIVAAISWINGVERTNSGIHTVGTVIDLVGSSEGNTVAPVVAFNLKNGQKHQFTSSISSSPPAYDIGETVELWYDPADPDKVLLSGIDRWFIPVLMGVFFLIFGGIGYGGLLYQFFKRRDINWLQQHGHPVEATFTGVHYNRNLRVNGASPFIIQAQWLDPSTNKMYVFSSDNIWFDPSDFVQDKTMRVLIDPKNPALYFMDISFLPEPGN